MMRSLLFVSAVVLAIAGTGSLAGAQRQDVTLWVTLGDSDQLVEVDAYKLTEIRRITTDRRRLMMAAAIIVPTAARAQDKVAVTLGAGRIFARDPFPGSFRVTPDGRSQAYTWHRALSNLYVADGLVK